MKTMIPVFLLLMLAILSACAPTPATEVAAAIYTNITVETLQTMLDERPDSFLLVNVHIPYQGDIPGTDLSIPYNEIESHLDQLPEDKNAEIVLYCRSDSMSHTASEELAEMGYSNVKNLIGGFNAWTAAGLPLESTE